MDHLQIPESCIPNVREIPYLGLAPKYDKLGFDGFPERYNWNPDELIASDSVLQQRAEWIESFIQEWLWFGLMGEFGKACDIIINLDDFIIDSPSGSGKIISTASIYDVYARRLAIRELDALALSLGLQMGDLVRLPYRPSESDEESSRQMIDFLARKVEQGMPSPETVLPQAMEKLSKPYGEDTPIRDETGIIVPLHTLRQRIVGCRVLISFLTKSPLPKPQLRLKRMELVKSIARVQGVLRTLMDRLDRIVRFEVIVSIDVLCHTLAKIIKVILDEPIPLYSPVFLEDFEKIMCARNWCPSRVSLLGGAENTPLAYIASLLPSYETISHGTCRPRKCLKLPTDTEAMVSAHREGCDRNCARVMIAEAELVKMWKEGGIPGVRLTNSTDIDSVGVVDCTGQPFIAISHVWAHGLGNPKRNESPFCQLQLLFELAKGISEKEVVLWIDTLSIPIQDQDAKRIAISKMYRVYSEASKVLAIDKDLIQVGSDHTEQIMRLLSSEWQRRLWTLQEGRLAKALFIQFKDRPVPVSELTAQKPVTQFTDSNADIFDFTTTLKLTMELQFPNIQNGKSDLAALTEDLAARSVTNKKDEPICLATLLGLSLENYHPYPTMEDIYRSLPAIPQDLMFLNQERLTVPGLTWAPSTLLETEFVSNMHGKGASSDSPPGQLVLEGLIVSKDSLFLDEDLDFRQISNNSPEIYIITTSHGKDFVVLAANAVSPEGCPLRIEPSRVIKNLVVIWRKPYDFFALDGSDSKVSTAVLVSRNFDREGIVYCKFEMGLQGWHIRDEHLDFHQKMIRMSGGVNGRVSAELKEKVTFCVG